VAMT